MKLTTLAILGLVLVGASTAWTVPWTSGGGGKGIEAPANATVEGRKIGDAPVVTVYSIRVSRPIPGAFPVQSETGTSLSFHIRLPFKDKRIVQATHKESFLERFEDDKGTVLAKPGALVDLTMQPWLRAGTPLVRGKAATCVISAARRVPARGATKLRFKGRIVLRLGWDMAEATAKNVEIRIGQKFKIGDLEMAFVKPNWPRKHEREVLFALQSAKMDQVDSFSFFDKKGNQLRHSQPGGYFNLKTGRWETRVFTLDQHAETLTIRIRYLSKTEKIVVPVDVTAGLGL